MGRYVSRDSSDGVAGMGALMEGVEGRLRWDNLETMEANYRFQSLG